MTDNDPGSIYEAGVRISLLLDMNRDLESQIQTDATKEAILRPLINKNILERDRINAMMGSLCKHELNRSQSFAQGHQTTANYREEAHITATFTRYMTDTSKLDGSSHAEFTNFLGRLSIFYKAHVEGHASRLKAFLNCVYSHLDISIERQIEADDVFEVIEAMLLYLQLRSNEPEVFNQISPSLSNVFSIKELARLAQQTIQNRVDTSVSVNFLKKKGGRWNRRKKGPKDGNSNSEDTDCDDKSEKKVMKTTIEEQLEPFQYYQLKSKNSIKTNFAATTITVDSKSFDTMMEGVAHSRVKCFRITHNERSKATNVTADNKKFTLAASPNSRDQGCPAKRVKEVLNNTFPDNSDKSQQVDEASLLRNGQPGNFPFGAETKNPPPARLLGRDITQSEARPGPENLLKPRMMEPPGNLKELTSVIEPLWVRPFLETTVGEKIATDSFSHRIVPLYSVRNSATDTAVFKGSQNANFALKELQMRLARPPKWAYWSAADSNTHKEHLAIEWGCECPEMMLNGHHFYLHSDHCNLLFLQLQNGKMPDLALSSIIQHSGHASRRLDNLKFIDDFEMDCIFPHLTSTIKSKAHQIAQPRIPPPKKSTQSDSSSQGERSYTPVKRSQVQTINPDISPVKYAADDTTGGTTLENTISESAHSQALSTQNLDVKSRDAADLNHTSENVASQKRPNPVQKRRQKRTRPEASPNSTVVELDSKAPRTSSRVKTQVQPMNISSSSSKSYNYA
ncbi:Oidioi.mRNA.OKI2018_I69.YSR.g17182.t1.cds [Oikopleura dioica]|uniref:Oidioi.mRNA.OKI2018_I69.YSR.g17182.t1.cds n=1 Tax=Oikopleura dioica TaxID=34765 RepID=A0ABN7SNI5_OIKDI|nr:Oidioi.mRNA.OKI2018_I69.YSR.g17182.t1.cds [Oikopleura dioica]